MGFLYSIIITVLILIQSGPTFSEDDMQTSLKIGKCRSACLTEYVRKSQMEHCWAEPLHHCNMCWDYCEMLLRLVQDEETRNEMCTDDICFVGCKFACKVYNDNYNSTESQNSYEVSTAEFTNSPLSWAEDMVAQTNSGTVFVAFAKQKNEKWEEIEQFAPGKPCRENENQNYSRISIYSITQNGDFEENIQSELPAEIFIITSNELNENSMVHNAAVNKQTMFAFYVLQFNILLAVAFQLNYFLHYSS